MSNTSEKSLVDDVIDAMDGILITDPEQQGRSLSKVIPESEDEHSEDEHHPDEKKVAEKNTDDEVELDDTEDEEDKTDAKDNKKLEPKKPAISMSDSPIVTKSESRPEPIPMELDDVASLKHEKQATRSQKVPAQKTDVEDETETEDEGKEKAVRKESPRDIDLDAIDAKIKMESDEETDESDDEKAYGETDVESEAETEAEESEAEESEAEESEAEESEASAETEESETDAVSGSESSGSEDDTEVKTDGTDTKKGKVLPKRKLKRATPSAGTDDEDQTSKKVKTEQGEKPIFAKKPHKFHPGTVALRDIRKYQHSTNLLIPALPFERLVRETAQNYKNDLRFTEEALKAVQSAAEMYITEMFGKAEYLSIHRGGLTLEPKDMKLAQLMGDLSRWS